MSTCDILLATYNGARYLPAQLDSLLAQDDARFRLLVRDDGSTDATPEILERYAARFEGRMIRIEDGEPTGSPRGNFSILMRHADADHVLFCDQDDVWLPHRVASMIRLLSEAETRHGAATPIYAATDLTPVDAELEPLAESFWDYKKTDPALVPRLERSLLTGGAFLGCASGMNRALCRKAAPVPSRATNHDWWAIQVAILFGHVVWSREKTVLYRVHGGNHSRPLKIDAATLVRRKKKMGKVKRGMVKKTAQAAALLEAFGGEMNADARRKVECFVKLPNRGFLGRRITILRERFLYPDMLRNLALVATV